MASFSKQIDANIRDVGYFDNSPSESSALSLGNPGAVLRHIALRFTGVTIPNGATITSAKIRFVDLNTKSATGIALLIQGVDEDNTAEFVISPENTARTRTKTTANVGWTGSFSQVKDSNRDTPDLTSIVQEIVDRAGWSSGNAMAFWLADNGSTSGQYIDFYEYASSTTKCAILLVDYNFGGSPSVSPSSSSSASISPSASASPSSSLSPSPSSSFSRSPSPSPAENISILEVAKDGVDILKTNDPRDVKFSSKYGTLKYFTKSQQIMTIDGSVGDFAGKKIFTHNLGYYPFVEVFVRVYIGTPSGNYEYVPFFGAGATVLYSANYLVKENTIELYGEFNGVSASEWTFDFLLFLYKNNLNL